MNGEKFSIRETEGIKVWRAWKNERDTSDESGASILIYVINTVEIYFRRIDVENPDVLTRVIISGQKRNLSNVQC